MMKRWLAFILAGAVCLALPFAANAYTAEVLYVSQGSGSHAVFTWHETGSNVGHYELAAKEAHTMADKRCVLCGYTGSTSSSASSGSCSPYYALSVSLQDKAMVMGRTAVGGTATVEVAGNVRSYGSTSAAIIGKAKVGQTFQVLDCLIITTGGGATWYKIPYGNGTAWISAGLVSVKADPSAQQPVVVQPEQSGAWVYPEAAVSQTPATVGSQVRMTMNGYGYSASTDLSQVVGMVNAGEIYVVQAVAYDLNNHAWYCVNGNGTHMWVSNAIVQGY